VSGKISGDVRRFLDGDDKVKATKISKDRLIRALVKTCHEFDWAMFWHDHERGKRANKDFSEIMEVIRDQYPDLFPHA
jgi:hypothetical protein